MTEETAIVNLLDKLDRTINSDQNLSTRAMGLLLLGKKLMDERWKDNKVKDPTELLIKQGLETLDL